MVSAGYLGLHYNLYMGWVRLLMLKHTGIYECECIKLCRDSTVHNSKLFHIVRFQKIHQSPRRFQFGLISTCEPSPTVLVQRLRGAGGGAYIERPVK